ncbi:MAG: ATP-binding domain-containing protein [gamma proteobacterium symbiont of Taylorina sp.]|nr:ATP-binding domain-containing protein [gamma proteobacterium symbiont of Taylorina sp.]
MWIDQRSKSIRSKLRGIRPAQIKVFEKLFNYRTDKLKGKKRALKYITILLNKYKYYQDFTLIEFSQFVKENIDSNISKVSSGKIKVFYEKYNFNQFLLCVSIPEDLSFHKTVHKAKGDEFNNVLLVLKEENDINFMINSDLNNNEEHRINYVALSRAKNRLFISIPTLDVSKKEMLNNNFEIENV